MFTVNDRMGTLAEAHFDDIRAGTFAGTSPFLAGTAYANSTPFVHPTNPQFINEFCGRKSQSWSWARTHGVLYKRPSDPHAMINVYGEPDDLLVMEAEDGGDPYIVVVDFKTGSSGNPKYSTWFEDKFHAAYRGSTRILCLAYGANHCPRQPSLSGLPTRRSHPHEHRQDRGSVVSDVKRHPSELHTRTHGCRT